MSEKTEFLRSLMEDLQSRIKGHKENLATGWANEYMEQYVYGRMGAFEDVIMEIRTELRADE